MDKIEKELRKLTQKERRWIKEMFNKLRTKKLEWMNIKKLKGSDNIFRIRRGDVRIIYRTDHNGIFVLAIERRR